MTSKDKTTKALLLAISLASASVNGALVALSGLFFFRRNRK